MSQDDLFFLFKFITRQDHSQKNIASVHYYLIGIKVFYFFQKDKNKDNILVDNIVGILLDKDKDFWAIWDVYAGSNIEFWIYSSKLCFSQTYCILFTTVEAFDIYFSYLNGVFNIFITNITV